MLLAYFSRGQVDAHSDPAHELEIIDALWVNNVVDGIVEDGDGTFTLSDLRRGKGFRTDR